MDTTKPHTNVLSERLSDLRSIVRNLVGSTQRKRDFLQHERVKYVVDCLVVEPPLDPTLLELSLSINSEAAAVLAALSQPSHSFISILLDCRAHTSVADSFHSLYKFPPPDISQSTIQRCVEVHLRALRTLYVDLVRYCGPRAFGTDVIGKSIDPAERVDVVEGKIHPAAFSTTTTSKGKGVQGVGDVEMKQRETETETTSTDEDLRANANVALDHIFKLSTLSPAQPLPVGPFSFSPHSPTKSRLSPPLDSLLELLIECSPSTPQSTTMTAQQVRVADSVCCFLSGTIRTREQRQVIAVGGKGVETLAALRRLVDQGSDKVREAALKALTAIVRDSPEAATSLISLEGPGGNIVKRLKPYRSLTQSTNPSVRLAAATLCSVLNKALAMPQTHGSQTSDVAVLLSLIEKEPSLRGPAAFSLAYLVADDQELQRLAASSGCFETFLKILADSQSIVDLSRGNLPSEETFQEREGILLVLATLTADSETNRRLLLDAKLLPHLLDSILFPSVGIRAASCHVIRALSRSVNVLRTHLVESNAQDYLVRLLAQDEDDRVKVTAVAMFSNLLLEFSPMRKVLVEAGCVPRMCQLAVKSENAALKLNALWAVKNAVYQSTALFKRDLLRYLTWNDLAKLISSSSFVIVEQSLGILRNITCVTQNESITGLAVDEMGEDRLLGLLEGQLKRGTTDGLHGDQIVQQALYCLNNIATANETAQLAIASRTSLLRDILNYLDSNSVHLRTASLWVLHNLIYRRGVSSYASPTLSSSPASVSARRHRRPHEIVEKLRVLGLEGKLRTMERDPELDVRERVRDLKEAMAFTF